MAVAAAAQTVQVDHCADLVHLRKSAVGKIPGARHSLFAGAEAHENHGTPEKPPVSGHHTGHFNQRRHARGVAVGAGKHLDDRLAVDRQGVRPHMVVPGAHHDILVAKLRIGAFDDTQDVLGTDLAAVAGDGEILPETVGQHQHARFGQRVVKIARRQPLAVAAGLAAVQFIVAERFHVPPQGRSNSKILCGEVRRTEQSDQNYR